METAYIQDESGQWWATVHNKDGSVKQRSRAYPRSCERCGEEFVSLYSKQYCSRDCSSRVKADRQIEQRTAQVCEQCREDFWNKHPQRFCSNACRIAFDTGKCRKQEPPRKCPICGHLFERKVRRQWRKTCSSKCARSLGDQHRGYLSGEDHPNWVGGTRYQTKAGYVMVYAGAGLDSRLEHRVVMEEMLGRPLERFEEVHHRNAIRNDNRPENLELWVKRQPGGSRAKDLIEYARWVLDMYGPLEDKL